MILKHEVCYCCGVIRGFRPAFRAPARTVKKPAEPIPEKDIFQAQPSYEISSPSWPTLAYLKDFVGRRALNMSGLQVYELMMSEPLSERVEEMKAESIPSEAPWKTPMKHVESWVTHAGLDGFKEASHQGKFNYMVSLKGASESLHAANELAHQLNEGPPVNANIGEMQRKTSIKNSETAHRITDTLIPPSFSPVNMVRRQLFRMGVKRNFLESEQQIDSFLSNFHDGVFGPKSEAEECHRQLAFSQMANSISKQLGQTVNPGSEVEAAKRVASEGYALLPHMNTGFRSGATGYLVNGLLSIIGPDGETVRTLHKQIVEQQILPWLKT